MLFSALEGKVALGAKVLADSITRGGDRLTTLEVELPRFLADQLLTHRAFSRNFGSTRAEPLPKQIERATTNPVLPIYWGATQSGMQARSEVGPDIQARATQIWLGMLAFVADGVRQLDKLGVHKQIAGRPLETWQWQKGIISATEWDNFLALRDSSEAQPEIQALAQMIRRARDESTPLRLRRGEWHLPLLQPDEIEWAKANPALAIKVCIGRCARVSYLTHDGRRDRAKDIELYERLRRSGHMSPFEHVARPMTWRDRVLHPRRSRSNFSGWLQHRKAVPNEGDYSKILAEMGAA